MAILLPTFLGSAQFLLMALEEARQRMFWGTVFHTKTTKPTRSTEGD
jgi:hypothetical protein